MASSLKKASSMIRNSFRTKRYVIFDAEENNYILTPKKNCSEPDEKRSTRFRPRNANGNVASASSSDENEHVPALSNPSNSVSKQSESKLKRGTSMTNSMRSAVGTLRQKFKLSTRRGQMQTTPKRSGTRQSTAKRHEVHLYSPFKIDTPKGTVKKHVKNCHSLETPTRLKREVEALTANMQVLSALTPNTLQSRSRARKSQILTNGHVRSPRSTCKRIIL